jgi:hypothetical protein
MNKVVMKKAGKWTLGAFLAAAGAVQFYHRPDLANPPVEPGRDLMARNAPPAPIAALLHAACYDCHSYETQWPWYSRVAPVSWIVAGDVHDAREAMNFSEWPQDDPSRAAKRWSNISRRVANHSMPLPSFTWMHPAARLTEEQRRQLSDWAAKTAQALK